MLLACCCLYPLLCPGVAETGKAEYEIPGSWEYHSVGVGCAPQGRSHLH